MGESLTVEVAQACQPVQQKNPNNPKTEPTEPKTRHTALKRHKPLSTRMNRASTRT
jgi:hypothetical protein